MAHHEYGASAAPRYIRCPGSVPLSKDLPDQETKYSKAGTLAHTIAEKALTQHKDAQHYPELLSDDLFDHVDNACRHIQTYIDYVRQTNEFGKYKTWIEQKVSLEPFVEGGFGTCDAIILKGHTLHIIDLKFGTSYVSVKHNEQLGLYAWGAYAAFMKAGKHVEKIVLHIVQPRINNVRSWVTTVDWLESLGDEVARAVAVSKLPNPPLNPSTKACQWCKAKAICPALHDQALATVGNDFETLPAVQTLPIDKAAHVLKHYKHITAWLDALKDYWLKELKAGKSLPGFYLDKKPGNREWTDDAKEVLVELLGPQAIEKKLIGITKANKLLPDLASLNITQRKKDTYAIKEVINDE